MIVHCEERTVSPDRASVLAEVQVLLDARIAGSDRYGGAIRELWELAARRVGGGKLLRPILLLDTCAALRRAGQLGAEAPVGAADAAVVLRCAAALELLHFAFLLHDDVIDHDLVRRGEENLVGELHRRGSARGGTQRSLHWARSAGLLLGDQLLALVHQEVARLRVPERRRTMLLDLLDDAVAESAAGELLDVGLADGMIPPERTAVMTMTRSKTAAYSFELPLGMAAVLAGADSGTTDALRHAGRCAGTAFQLQDDLLSAFGDERLHGKDPWSDIREGKRTLLIEAARGTPAWPRIQEALGGQESGPRDGERLRMLLEQCGARARVEEEIRAQLAAARRALAPASSPVPAEVAQVIDQHLRRLEGRSR
ncbi:polyprenyl synthetase family protein [Brachybacterium hainanense]|uniref:Polyprenyl synthetase family protein n=1 Tax=Brachybacterium hainanense TaxID=1541174 RepID=A0ABV6RBL0_9MICO